MSILTELLGEFQLAESPLYDAPDHVFAPYNNTELPYTGKDLATSQDKIMKLSDSITVWESRTSPGVFTFIDEKPEPYIIGVFDFREDASPSIPGDLKALGISNKYLCEKKIWLDKKYRGSGFALKFYMFMAEKKRTAIISDRRHFGDAKKLWTTLATISDKFEILLFDRSKNELLKNPDGSLVSFSVGSPIDRDLWYTSGGPASQKAASHFVLIFKPK